MDETVVWWGLLAVLFGWLPTVIVVRMIQDARRDRIRREAQRIAHEQRQSEEASRRQISSEERYGPEHQALREAWKPVIRMVGAECMEDICLYGDHRIAAGARGDEWDLAHDHRRGGRFDYKGPAHKACNQYEALIRGGWRDAPTLEEFKEQFRAKTGTDPWAAEDDLRGHGDREVWVGEPPDHDDGWEYARVQDFGYLGPTPTYLRRRRRPAPPNDPWAAPGVDYAGGDDPPF